MWTACYRCVCVCVQMVAQHYMCMWHLLMQEFKKYKDQIGEIVK